MTPEINKIISHINDGKPWEVDGKKYHCKTVDVLPVIKFGAMTVAAITGFINTGFFFSYRLLGHDYEGFVPFNSIILK